MPLSISPRSVICVALFLMIGSSLAADPLRLFGVNVRDSETDVNIEVSSQSARLIDLISKLFEGREEFAIFEEQGLPIFGEIRYYGIEDALLVEVDSTGRHVTLRSELSDLEVSFSGVSRQDMTDQIENWFKEVGMSELSKLEERIAGSAPTSLSDGNPNSSTARLAASIFSTYAFGSIRDGGRVAQSFGQLTPDARRGPAVGVEFSYDRIRADVEGGTLRGEALNIEFPFHFALNPRMRFIGSVPLSYTDMAGTEIYGGGINLGFQSHIRRSTPEQPWGWAITPFAGGLARGTYDGAFGTLIWTAGLLNQIDYRLSDRWYLSFASQFGVFESSAITIGGVRWDNAVSQQILKNGIRLATPLGHRWVFESMLIHNFFVQSVHNQHYWTVGVNASYRLAGNLRLGFNAKSDFAVNYRSLTGGVFAIWRF